MNIIHSLLGPSSFWIWRNILEILIFSFLVYKISLYLRRDKTKNLLPYFYGYCALACTSYFLQLGTLSYTLFLFAPAAICLFILFHQETLQRNFVAIKQLAAQQPTFIDSLEVLMRCTLIALNNKQEVTVLIEYNDNLNEFLESNSSINSPINYDLLVLLLESPSYDQKKMLWVTHTGIIRGMNAQWHDELTAKSTIGATQILTAQDLHEWYTTKTDCLVFELNPIARTFALTAHGTTKQNLSSAHVLQMIKKHSLNLGIQKEGAFHGSNKKFDNQQRTT